MKSTEIIHEIVDEFGGTHKPALMKRLKRLRFTVMKETNTRVREKVKELYLTNVLEENIYGK